MKLLQRWRDEAGQAGHTIKRLAVAFEAAGDGFWLARWLRPRDIEAYAIHPASVAVSREHRRAKTDRLDTERLMRALARRKRLCCWRTTENDIPDPPHLSASQVPVTLFNMLGRH
ncbi:MAG: transposase [Mesorhizobium sp.]|nr:MAG: transposase [Mesorhizobium sp.]